MISLLLAAAAVTAPADPLAALDRFVGTWQTTGTFVQTPYSKPNAVSSTTTCAWSADRVFLVCRQAVTLDGKTLSDLGIYTYDPQSAKYRFFSVRQDGGSNMTIAVDAASIEYDSSFDDNGTTVMNRTRNVWDAPDRYHFSTEYSTDGGKHWTTMLSGSAHRTAP